MTNAWWHWQWYDDEHEMLPSAAEGHWMSTHCAALLSVLIRRLINLLVSMHVLYTVDLQFQRGCIQHINFTFTDWLPVLVNGCTYEFTFTEQQYNVRTAYNPHSIMTSPLADSHNADVYKNLLTGSCGVGLHFHSYIQHSHPQRHMYRLYPWVSLHFDMSVYRLKIIDAKKHIIYIYI